jgi:hypothetical protein
VPMLPTLSRPVGPARQMSAQPGRAGISYDDEGERRRRGIGQRTRINRPLLEMFFERAESKGTLLFAPQPQPRLLELKRLLVRLKSPRFAIDHHRFSLFRSRRNMQLHLPALLLVCSTNKFVVKDKLLAITPE